MRPDQAASDAGGIGAYIGGCAKERHDQMPPDHRQSVTARRPVAGMTLRLQRPPVKGWRIVGKTSPCEPPERPKGHAPFHFSRILRERSTRRSLFFWASQNGSDCSGLPPGRIIVGSATPRRQDEEEQPEAHNGDPTCLRKLFKTPISERWGKQICLNE